MSFKTRELVSIIFVAISVFISTLSKSIKKSIKKHKIVSTIKKIGANQ